MKNFVNPFYNSGKFAGQHIHLGISGSIACYKAADLLRAWLKLGIQVSATLTEGAGQFVTPLLFKALGAKPVYGDMFNDQDVFAHLEPGATGGAMVLAPASANLISRLACGAASDMLSAQVLAFEGPVVVAPAMNPRMWNNQATMRNVSILKERGQIIVSPEEGLSACGESGKGRLARQEEIFLFSLLALAPKDMRGLKVMATIGPTREAWDGMRYLSNPSSGRMGVSLATSAWLRGAEVTVICGPGVDIYIPEQIRRVDVESAKEMFEQAKKIWPEMDMGFFCAAVADFAPIRPADADNTKIKKTSEPEMRIQLELNPDILKTLSALRRPDQKILGFAAEITKDMDSLIPLAREKLTGKNMDLIAANRINKGEGAFGSSASSMLVLDKNDKTEIWTTQDKADLAWELCSWLLKL